MNHKPPQEEDQKPRQNGNQKPQQNESQEPEQEEDQESQQDETQKPEQEENYRSHSRRKTGATAEPEATAKGGQEPRHGCDFGLDFRRNL
jgi:hypothetical protein